MLKKFAVLSLIFALTFAAGTQSAMAQTDEIIRTVFCIADVNATLQYHLNAFSVNGDELILAETWQAAPQGLGPVGLAVDPIAEHLYVISENMGVIEAYDARNATPLNTITLTGTSNLTGIDVRVDEGLLYVIDRGQTTLWVFDSDTFEPVESWTLDDLGGDGAYDIEVIENWDSRGVIFVSNGSSTVNYYDLDTQERLGSYTMSNIASSVAVDNHQGTPVVFAASTSNGTPGEHSYLLKYDADTGQQDQVNLSVGSDGRGVSVNPIENLVYVNVGTLLAGSLRVYDQDTLTLLHTYTLQGSPTGTETSNLAFGSSVKKDIINESANALNGPGEFDAGEDIVFGITLTNKRDIDIHVMPLTDIYDTTQLIYVSSTVEPADSTDDGELDWTDMITVIGHDLAFEEEYTFEVTFHAEPDVCERFVTGTNIINMHDAFDAGDEAIDGASGSADYKIWCTCRTDEDCNDGIFCNGAEECRDRQCAHLGNPCPIDDGNFCNGEETIECIEETQSCGHTGDPCVNDGTYCNGTESCDETNDQCLHSGDPCPDNENYCDGVESCVEDNDGCQSSGDPCDPDTETCNEDTDSCDLNADDDADDDINDDADDDDEIASTRNGEDENDGCCCG